MQTVTESQNCLVLPAPHKRASRPAPDFTVLFIKNKTIIAALVGNDFQRCWVDEQRKESAI